MANLLSRTKTGPQVDLPRVPPQSSPLMYVALALFVLALFAYGALFMLIRAEEKNADRLTEEIRASIALLDQEDLSQVLAFGKRTQHIRELTQTHIAPTRVFDLLETETLPQVRFDRFQFAADGIEVGLSGETVNFSMIARQITRLESHPAVSMVEFDGLSLGENNLVSFELRIAFKPDLIVALTETPDTAAPPSQ